MNATPAIAAIRKQAATPRSARFSAFVPRIGNRSRRWTMWMSSVSAPAIIRSSGVIARSSSAVCCCTGPCVPWGAPARVISSSLVLIATVLRSTG